MKYIGIFFLFAALFVSAREYRRLLLKRLSELRAFIDFLRHIRLEIGCFLSPPNELCRGFSSPVLEELGFISQIESGEPLLSSYKRVSKRLSLGDTEKSVLLRLFSELGDGYLDESIKLIDFSVEKLSCSLSELEEDVPKRIKLASVLFATGGVGAVLLLI